MRAFSSALSAPGVTHTAASGRARKVSPMMRHFAASLRVRMTSSRLPA